jgi:plastocyanin
VNRYLSAVLLACCTLVLVAGCGSSESTSSTSSSSPSGSSSSNSSSTGTGAKSGKAPSSGLHTDTTPKYASPSPSAPVQSGVVQISYRNIAIDPDTLKVKVGSTVKWTNYDSVEHNVTSKGGPTKFTSSNFGENGTYEVKLTKPGVIHYECSIHPVTMNGTIEVTK